KPLNKKDGFCKSLISGCFVAPAGVLTHSCAEGKTPAIPLPSPCRPTGGTGCRYQLFNKLTKTYLDWYSIKEVMGASKKSSKNITCLIAT
ncbi:MAG TPA: hypothetical protein P5556_06320, partial [Candidatus Gastranaerophilales bacterium]|nr:hypothetical protein [Candidatus Gastranaerophilales bacterium]